VFEKPFHSNISHSLIGKWKKTNWTLLTNPLMQLLYLHRSPWLQKHTADLFRMWNCHTSQRTAPPSPSHTYICPFTDSALKRIFNLPQSPFALCLKTFEFVCFGFFFLANICFLICQNERGPTGMFWGSIAHALSAVTAIASCWLCSWNLFNIHFSS